MVFSGALIAIGTLILLGVFAFVGPFHDSGTYDPVVWLVVGPWALIAFGCIGGGFWIARNRPD